MNKDAVELSYIKDYRIFVRFRDGKSGEIDFSRLLNFVGMVAQLKDLTYFKQVTIDTESGALVWPNGVDICPDLAYATATGSPLPGEKTSANAA